MRPISPSTVLRTVYCWVRTSWLTPADIEDYIAIGGYTALAKVLTSMRPEEVIAEIRASGLRGRGGGGFPTARKWEACRRAPGSPKFVICNADEGDPGAYMNRSVLEGNPHSVLEGMIIGAYAIGAQHGFIYVRTEYPLAVEHSRMAVEQAREYGLLGENILGSGFSFDVRVARGAGAFVSGESTALMAALEGKVSEPRPKDVHTVEQGYKNLPSNLNNVETWANVPLIINNGSAWFAAKGTAEEHGHQDLRPDGTDQEHGPGRGGIGHAAQGPSSTTSAAGPSMAKRSRPCKSGGHRAAVSLRSCSTCRWISRP